MKTIKSILKAACVALIAASCTNEIDNSVKVSQLFEAYFAENAPETRVVIDSELKAVTWEFTDNIAIFDAGYAAPVKANVSSIADEGKKAIFAPTAAVLNPAYALHPYQAAATVEGNVVSAIVPGAALGTLTESCIAVSKADDGKFAFKSVAGIFQFTVSDPDVKSVVIKGEGIAGGIKATVDAGSVTVAPYGTPDNEIEVPEIAPNQVCYVAVVPKEYSGLTFIYKDKNGAELGKTVCTDKVQVNAGDILTWGDFAKLQKAYLPAGPDFNDALSTVAGGNLQNITSIAFMTGYKPVGTVINEGTEGAPIGIEFSNGIVFICTPANEYVANASMNNMFNAMKKLQTISGLEKIDTRETTDMRCVFRYCHELTSVNLSNFNTSKVTDMLGMFYECKSLKSLNVSNFDVSNVTSMQAMFSNLTSLETLDLSNFNTAKVTNMMYGIKSCPKLTTLILGSNFKVPSNNLDMYAELGTSNSTPYTTFYCDINQWNTVMSLIGSSNIVNYRWGNAPADAQLPTGTDFRTAVINAVGSASYVKTITFETYSAKTGTQINEGLGDTPVYVSNSSGKVTVSTQAAGFKANANCKDMFRDLSSLTAIYNLDAVNTSEVINMDTMFGHDPLLTSLDLSSFNTTNVTNMFALFYEDYALSSIDLSSFNTSKVTNMGSMFHTCSSLTSLDLSGFNTSNVTVMWYMFKNCSALTSLNLSNFNTSKVTNMMHMFYNCSSLATLTLGSKFTTAEAVSMERMFWNCQKLQSLDLSKFNTAKVTSMVAMFRNAVALTSLDLSSFNTAKVTAMDSMFYDSNAIATLKLGSNFKTPATAPKGMYIDMGTTSTNTDFRTFLDCAYDQWIDFVRVRAASGNSVTSYKWKNVPAAAPLPAGQALNTALKTVAGDLANIKTVTFTPESYITNGTLVSTGTSPVYINYSSGNITIYTPSSEFSTTSCSHYFSYCSAMTTINGLTKLNTANSTSMNRMFEACYVLTSIDLSKFNTAKVQDFECMFWHCDAVTTLDVSTFSSASATNVKSMFCHLANLASINFGSNFTLANATNTEYMFAYNDNLTSLDLSYFNTANVQAMSNMFNSSPKIATIKLGSNFKFPSSGTSFIFSSLGTSNTEPYTKFTCDYDQWMRITGLVSDQTKYVWANAPAYAPLPTGLEFNKAILALVNNDTTKIKRIQVQSGEPAFCKGKLINASYGVSPVYLYDSGDCIYITSPSKAVQAHPNSSMMFYKLRYVTQIGNLSSRMSTSNVTDMSSMFEDCEALKNLNLHYSNYFMTTNVTNMSRMFYNCKSLPSLNLSRFNTSKVTNMANMFTLCASLTSMDLSNINTSNVTSFQSLFWGCEQLETVTFASDISTANVTNFDGMFCACAALKSVDLSKFNTAKATTMRNMFSSCTSLTSLDLSSFNTSKVTTMHSMFAYTNKLATLRLGTNFSIGSADTTDMIKNLGSSNTSGTFRATIYSTPATRTKLIEIQDASNIYNWYNI